MKVWVIRLSMVVTLDAAAPTASPNLLSWTRPVASTPSPSTPAPAARPAAGEARAVARGRLADDRPKRAAERAEAVEADVEADLGHRPIGLAQQLHRPLDAATLQVPVRRLAECRPELTAEMCRRDVGHPRERRNVERLRERRSIASRARSILRLRSSTTRDINPTA